MTIRTKSEALLNIREQGREYASAVACHLEGEPLNSIEVDVSGSLDSIIASLRNVDFTLLIQAMAEALNEFDIEDSACEVEEEIEMEEDCDCED